MKDFIILTSSGSEEVVVKVSEIKLVTSQTFGDSVLAKIEFVNLMVGQSIFISVKETPRQIFEMVL